MSSLRILVLDDDELQLELLQRFFAHEGFVVEVSQGPSALADEARTFSPDFVLLDVNVPGLGPARLPELVEALRAERRQVLLFSAEDESKLRVLVTRTHADGYLSKGTSLPTIAEKLRTLAALTPRAS